MDAVEAGVHLAAQLGDVAAGLREKFAQIDATGSVHGVDGDAQAAGADAVEIDDVADVRVVRGQGIEALDAPGSQGVSVVHSLGFDVVCQVGMDTGLDGLGRLWRGGAAVGRLELDAIVAGRVVAGGDHDAAVGCVVDDGVADQRCGGVRLRQQDIDAIGGENLGNGDGIAVAEETGVEADDDSGGSVGVTRLRSAPSVSSLMACATCRTLSKVKSSLMTARQPSVPNRIVMRTLYLWVDALRRMRPDRATV